MLVEFVANICDMTCVTALMQRSRVTIPLIKSYQDMSRQWLSFSSLLSRLIYATTLQSAYVNVTRASRAQKIETCSIAACSELETSLAARCRYAPCEVRVQLKFNTADHCQPIRRIPSINACRTVNASIQPVNNSQIMLC